VAQFDKELSVYEQIWATLIDVAKAVAQLRPVLDRFDPAQTEDERKSARLSRLDEAAQRYLDQVNKERPFYATEVYKSLQELVKIVRVEAVEYQYGDSSKLGDYWEKALGNSEAIRAKVDEICEAIRGRIDGISAT
jgi:DNA repair ATPase RecN